MNIGFTGTRDGMTEQQREALILQLCNLALFGRTCDHASHGDCVGADEEFHSIIRRYFPSVLISTHPAHVPAKLRAFCEADTVWEIQSVWVRNKNIVRCADVMFAAPKEMENPGKGGTWGTYQIAADQNRPRCLILPDGAYRWENTYSGLLLGE